MKKIFVALSILVLAACGKGFQATDVEIELQKAVDANKDAKSYPEFHLSKDSPENIFSNLIRQFLNKEIDSEIICEALLNQSDVDLSLFENLIRQEQTNFIIKPCLPELQSRLEQYWEQERNDLKPKDSGKARRFAEVVYAERDVSQGYMAVMGDLEPGQVALTFDDGPHELYTNEVLKALDEANVKATFFVMGESVRQNPEILKQIDRAGHAIGSHSNTHRCLGSRSVCGDNNKKDGVPKILSFEEAKQDILLGHQAVKNVLGRVYPFFRFPFGETSPELKQMLKKSGTGEFYWSIDSNDWRIYKSDKVTPYRVADMVEEVMKGVRSLKKGIILNHDIQKKTAVGLSAILNRLFDEGFQPVMFIPKDKNSIIQSGLLNQDQVEAQDSTALK